MEKQERAALIHNFDEFVQVSLQHKGEAEQQLNPLDNQVDHYLDSMEKRLKLRPVSHQQKFENILKPMKQLNSFVSVREFMQKLGGRYGVGKKSKSSQRKSTSSIKQQYENARGGYYIKKIEEHLKQQNFKRTQQSTFFDQIETDPMRSSQFSSWAETALGGISPRPETLFRVNTEVKEEENIDEEDCLLQEHKKIYHEQFKVVPKIREMCLQEYESFSKISCFLTARLRKLLKSNCAPRKSNKVNFILPEKKEESQQRLLSQRTSIGVAQKHKEKKESQKNTMCRVKTAGCTRKEEQSWRDQLNQRIKQIVREQSKAGK